MIGKFAAAAAIGIVIATPAPAATARDVLIQAAFQTTDKKLAITRLEQALAMASGTDADSQLQRATAVGYLAKLNRSPGEAKKSRAMFEAIAAANPRDAEAQLLLGGWHLDALDEGFIASRMLGAKKEAGLAGIDKAVALGGDRAFYRGFAAMMRIRLDPKDVQTPMRLALAAAAAPAPTALDRIAKRSAEALLLPLKAGDGKAAAALARKLLPFGRID